MISSRPLVYFLLLTTALAAPLWRLEGAQPAGTNVNLTVEDVIKLCQSGFSEELIITKLKKSGKAFDLSAEELVDIKKAGVSDNVIKFLLDPSQPYSSPSGVKPGGPEPVATSPPKPLVPAKPYAKDALASRVPWE